jgi:hypothetical protein
MLRKEPTVQFQIGLALKGAWQVLDLKTGRPAMVGVLVLNSMGRKDAEDMCELLNELAGPEN